MTKTCERCGREMYLNGMFYSCEDPAHPNVDVFDEAKDCRIAELERELEEAKAVIKAAKDVKQIRMQGFFDDPIFADAVDRLMKVLP